MVISNANDLRPLFPGIFCQGPLCVRTQETDNIFDLTIEPEADSLTKLFFILPNDVVEKKYHINVNFNHANASVHIFGLYQMCDQQSIEIKTTINHLMPHCSSKQLWKGILNDSAKALFEGRIIVSPNAQKTDAQLSNKNLLLSNSAEINTKPILEIYADDVKCSHGATVGCLDDNALFYLRARGIEHDIARQLLIKAFADEILTPFSTIPVIGANE